MVCALHNLMKVSKRAQACEKPQNRHYANDQTDCSGHMQGNRNANVSNFLTTHTVPRGLRTTLEHLSRPSAARIHSDAH